MKKIQYILLSVFALYTFSSCEDLDLKEKGKTDSKAVFGSEYGVKSYMAPLYNYLPIEDFNYHVERGFRQGWDALKGAQMSITGEVIGWPWGIDGAQGFGYWPYGKIRDINTLIEGLPENKNNFAEESTYNQFWGEAHFLRAYYYFGLVKRYGGMPFIDRVQSPNDPIEELQVKRATETELYKHIYDDLKIAIDNMQAPKTPQDAEKGRANKYVAMALMSRAMLYAGTIAKYGGYTTSSPDEAAQKGYVGIPSSEAKWFFQMAYETAKSIETSGAGYALHDANVDKEQNLVDYFLSINNTEDIFIKQYTKQADGDAVLRHSWDGCTAPSGDFASWPGSQVYPTLETVELFQELPIEEADGKPRRFNSKDDLKEGLEPRLLASVYFTGMELRGSKFDIRRGFYKTYNGTMDDAQLGSTNAPINAESNRIVGSSRDLEYNGERLAGKHGTWNNDIENTTGTGFFIRKYVNYKAGKADAAGYESHQAWKDMRYAEVLLNRAEAAYELYMLGLGNEYATDAFEQIAKIRDRAGATAYTQKSSPAVVYTVNNEIVDENLQFIRDERARELLFENHKWWDLRRWRVADRELKQVKPLGLMPYKVLDDGKYIFIKEYNILGKSFNFEVRWFYEKIPAGELNKNPNLIDNPIY